MPTISTFYGIIIRMFFAEHAPPHFPRRALELVLDWAELHRQELVDNWELCQRHQQPRKVEPLQ